MKKLISIVMIMFLLIGILASNVSAVDSCTVSLGASSTSVKKGNTVTVTINYSKPAGAVAPIVLNYDSSVLKFKSSTNTIQATPSGNTVTLRYLDTNFTKKTISNMTVTFEAISAGTSNCSIASARISNEKGSKYNVSIGGGTSIKVTEPTPSNPNQNTTKPNNTQTNTSQNNTSNNTTTNKDPKFTNVNQTVYAKSEVNIRKSWTTSSASLGRLQKDDSIRRTGYSNNGWSRVIYRGQVAYINSAYLTTTKPKEDDKKDNEEKNNTTNNETTNEITNNTVENEVTNNEVINNEVTTNNEIGNVNGNNEIKQEEEKPDYIFYGIIIIIIIAIIIIIISTIYEGRRNSKSKRR